MSFSGKQKKAALQEKRERDRLRAEQETAREKARLAAEDAARERKRQEELTGGAAASSTAASVSTPSSHAAAAADDDDDDVGIRPVRRNVAVAQPGVHATAAPPPPVSDEDDVGGIVPVRRNNKGVTAKSAAATSSSSSAPAPAAASVASGSTSVPSTINALTASAHTKTLRTAFARESDELIEARKKAAREPLKRDHLSSDGGTESVDYYSREEIAIPMRPDWHGKTPAQLEADEAKYFNDWLERIYQTYGQDRLNHYEHNLEVWRQLWRVCERSDILLVIVDSRQPILNFPPSLYHYITQTLKKPMILVLNKIDLIPNEVVNEWITYFHRRYPSLHVIPFTSFPAERRDTLDHLKKSKVKRGRGMTLVKPYGAEDLLRACQQIVQDKNQLRGNVPEEVRKAFNFDPTLLSGGVHAVEKTEQMYAGADEYMRTGDNDDGEDDIGASSLSKELKQMGVLKKHKADQRRKAKAEKLRLANEALMPSSEDEDASEDESEAESSSSKKKDKHKKRGSKKKQSRVRMGATDDVHEYNQDAEEVDSADEADASIVAANTRAFSGVLGQLEDVRSAEQEEEARARVTEFITLGCLGQPNAGKSSLINALAGKKLVSVSKTPGHTKYLQTLFLNKNTRLCDCPGLVFPAVDMPRSIQVLAGSFPIAQTREPYSAVGFLAERLEIEKVYGLQPPADEAVELDGAGQPMPFRWSAWTLCEALAQKKGFFNRQGQPDVYRGANFILREVLDGIVTFFFKPPK